MKNLLFTLLLILPFQGFSQIEKAVKPVASPCPVLPAEALRASAGKTRAVVIGISDYQDPQIPDLRFADNDAEAFANFLRSPAGGSLDGDHLKVLIDSQATFAQFDAALNWLMDESKPGDQAIIYFSGHGDVETKTRSQHGFLLCWDSPLQSYISGAYPIFFLKDVVTTLSTENKARVLIITDACRSGKLAGNSIGGAQLTSQNLAQQFANEIKILSCQPNEYSLEGEQWGGGRGAFSFHLVDGLYGLADGNSDGSVNLMEIGRHLEDHVTQEVSPQSQVPMTVGNRTEKLAAVFPDILAQVKKNKTGQLPLFSAIDSKGIEDEVLATVDSTIRALYYSFKKALKEKVFLEPPGECADAYYLRLMAEPKLERLHNSMRRNYAAALQDDAQQAINNLMKMEPTEIQIYRMERLKKYAAYPRLLERAAELLGPEHYMRTTLQARQLFFEGWLLQMESPLNPDSALAENLLKKYRRAVGLEPGFALAYYQMSTVFHRLYPSPDSLLFYRNKSIELAPSWTWAINQTAFHFIYSEKFEIAKALLKKSININPDNADTWGAFGFYHFVSYRNSRSVRDLDTTEQYLFHALKLDSTNYGTWYYLGLLYFHGRKDQAASLPYFLKASRMEKPSAQVYLYLGAVHHNASNFVEAEKYYKLGLSVDPYHDLCAIYLAGIYMQTERREVARELLLKILAHDSTSTRVQSALGNLLLENSYYADAESAFKRCISIDSLNVTYRMSLGYVYWATERYVEAESMFRRALQLNSDKFSRFLTYEMWKLLESHRYEQAEQLYRKIIQHDPALPGAYYALACLQSIQNQVDNAFETLEQAIVKGMNDYDWLQQTPDLAPLRERTEQWKTLMKKYFPDQVKD